MSAPWIDCTNRLEESAPFISFCCQRCKREIKTRVDIEPCWPPTDVARLILGQGLIDGKCVIHSVKWQGDVLYRCGEYFVCADCAEEFRQLVQSHKERLMIDSTMWINSGRVDGVVDMPKQTCETCKRWKPKKRRNS